MKVFVTGASGWIGSAVIPELLEAGHTVVGLARTSESAVRIESLGGQVFRGSLDDLDGLREAAAASDGVIHLAFMHDVAFSGGFEQAAQADRLAIETFGDALAGSERPLLIASGTLGLAIGRVATELDGHTLDAGVAALGGGPSARWANAEYTLSLVERGVRASIVRLAPTNHGVGDNGFITSLIGIARDKGIAGYVGDGSSRWNAVHRLDTAHLFALALEGAPAGSTLHAVAEEGVSGRDIAAVIGKHLNLPVSSIIPKDAASHFGWMAHFVAMDSPVSSVLTRQLLGWNPTHVGLIEDLDQGHYFE